MRRIGIGINPFFCILLLESGVLIVCPTKAMADYDCQIKPTTIIVLDSEGRPIREGSIRMDISEQRRDFGFPQYDDGAKIYIPMFTWRSHLVGTETLTLDQNGQAYYSGGHFKSTSSRRRRLRVQVNWLGDSPDEPINSHQKRIQRVDEASFDCELGVPANIRLTVKQIVVPIY